MAAFRASGHHSFWPDEISLCEGTRFDATHIAGHRQLTDVYLLGLAVRRDGRLATFDGRIHVGAVQEARPEHLALIGSGSI